MTCVKDVLFEALCLACSLLLVGSAAGQGDLNSLRAVSWHYYEPVQEAVWTVVPGDGVGPAILRVDFDPGVDGVKRSEVLAQAPLMSAALPVERLGAMLVQEVTAGEEWLLVGSGAAYEYTGSTLPEVSGVMFCATVRRDSATGDYNCVYEGVSDLGGLDLSRLAFREHGMFGLSYGDGDVVYVSAQDYDFGSVPVVMPDAQDFVSLVPDSAQRWWRNSLVGVSFQKIEGLWDSDIALRCTEAPLDWLDLRPAVGGMATANHVVRLDPYSEGLVVNGFSYVNGKEGMQVLHETADGSPYDVTVLDELGVPVFSGAGYASGQWVTLPAVEALHTSPGRKYRLQVDGSGGAGAEVLAGVRWGRPWSEHPGFDVSRVVTNPVQIAGSFAGHGVYVTTSGLTAGELVDLQVIVATRVAGQDPVSFDSNDPDRCILSGFPVRICSDLQVDRLHGSVGFEVAVPASAVGQIYLVQYVFTFSDGTRALSDVFGARIVATAQG